MEKLLLCVNCSKKEVALRLASEIAKEYRRVKEESEKENKPVATRKSKNKREIEENLLRENVFYKALELFSNRKKLRKYRSQEDKKIGITRIEISSSSGVLEEYSRCIIGKYEFNWKNNLLSKVITP